MPPYPELHYFGRVAEVEVSFDTGVLSLVEPKMQYCLYSSVMLTAERSVDLIVPVNSWSFSVVTGMRLAANQIRNPRFVDFHSFHEVETCSPHIENISI